MKKENKILIISGTHGDERITEAIIKLLKKTDITDKFESIIGNPKAWSAKKRLIDVDLNRCYPGKKTSDKYEENIAYKNLMLTKKYSVVIDLHEANKSKDDFIVIPKSNLSDKKLISYISINNIVLWPSTSKRRTGPITQFINKSFELEIGTQNINKNEKVKKIAKILNNFITNYYNKKELFKNKKIFLVYDKLMTEKKSAEEKIVDFKKTKIINETFYPLLSNQYITNGIVCYKMKLL